MKILKGMNDIAVHQHLEDPFEDGNGILTRRKGVTYGLEDARQVLVTYWETTYKAKRASLLVGYFIHGWIGEHIKNH